MLMKKHDRYSGCRKLVTGLQCSYRVRRGGECGASLQFGSIPRSPAAGPRAERTEGGKIRCVKNVLLARTSNFYGGNKIE